MTIKFDRIKCFSFNKWLHVFLLAYCLVHHLWVAAPYIFFNMVMFHFATKSLQKEKEKGEEIQTSN